MGYATMADTQSSNMSTQLEHVGCKDDDFDILAERSRVMKWEKHRRETFKTWPAWSCQRPEYLAKAGFYYTKISDRVQCAFCLGVLKNWEIWDEPMFEHRRLFPYCKFIQGWDVGNVPIEDNARQIRKQISPVCVGSEATREVDFKKEVNRLASFSRWPPELIQTPETLARAGFYHAPCEKKPDRVKCAYCQGKLYNWQFEDDPWFEHARCFPYCPYVKLCVGQDNIVDLLYKERVLEENIPESEKDQQISAHENNSSPEDNVTKLMKCEAVQAVLEMGFSQKQVQKVLKNYSKSGKVKHISAAELASDILHMEDALERAKTISQTNASSERTQGIRTQASKTNTIGTCGLQDNATSNNTGAVDKAECSSCGIRLYNWQDDMDPFAIHKKYTPGCVFLTNTGDVVRCFLSGETLRNWVLC